MGRIDGCFANAGVSQARAPLAELPTKEWKRVLSVNLDGAFFTLRAAARHMAERSKAGRPGLAGERFSASAKTTGARSTISTQRRSRATVR